MTGGSPRAREHELLAARALLDDALLGLGKVEGGVFPREEALARVSSSLGHVYQALAARADYASFRRECSEALAGAREALLTLQFREHEDLPVLDTMRLVAQAIGILNGTLHAPVEMELDLPRADGAPATPRASYGEPRVVSIARGVLQPALAFPTEDRVELEIPAVVLPETTVLPSMDELERMAREAEDLADAIDTPAAPRPEGADPREEPATPRSLTPDEVDEALFGVQRSIEDVLMERASDYLDELGMMSRIRRPGAGFDWNDLAGVEDRLLARIDAILACGDWVLPALVSRLHERPVADPEMLWGLLLLFGSLAGDDALDQISRLTRACDLTDVEVFDAVADAWTHVPNARAETQLRRWLGSDEPDLRRVALRSLGLRRHLHPDQISVALKDPEPSVRLEGARAATRAVSRVSAGDVNWMLASEDEAIVIAGFEAGLVHGIGAAGWKAQRLTEEGRGEWACAAIFLALCGDETMTDVLASAVATGPSAALYEAIGWYGSVTFVDFLLGRLSDGEIAAVAALQRITGATLTDDDPEPEYSEDDLPFAGERRWPVFEPELSVDADVWKRWWTAHRSRVDPSLRYRHGHVFDLDDCLWEMEVAPAENHMRWLACLELMARTGSSLPFDPHLFAPSQRLQIAKWRELVSSGRGRFPAGRWQTRLSS